MRDEMRHNHVSKQACIKGLLAMLILGLPAASFGQGARAWASVDATGKLIDTYNSLGAANSASSVSTGAYSEHWIGATRASAGVYSSNFGNLVASNSATAPVIAGESNFSCGIGSTLPGSNSGVSVGVSCVDKAGNPA